VNQVVIRLHRARGAMRQSAPRHALCLAMKQSAAREARAARSGPGPAAPAAGPANLEGSQARTRWATCYALVRDDAETRPAQTPHARAPSRRTSHRARRLTGPACAFPSRSEAHWRCAVVPDRPSLRPGHFGGLEPASTSVRLGRPESQQPRRLVSRRPRDAAHPWPQGYALCKPCGTPGLPPPHPPWALFRQSEISSTASACPRLLLSI